ncbi:MAG: hypothetical protein R6U40_05130 [Desulfobacterales bacterium]
MVKKVDNANAQAKLDLRRYLLKKYHADPVRVLDCCQGDGLLWGRLRQEFSVGHYWGVDIKAKKGRLSLDSSRILCQGDLDYDVIDIDTYGAPWKHWEALLPNISHAVTVFLTIGQWQMGTSNEIKQALGIRGLGVPPGICRKLHAISVSYCLARSYDYDIILQEVVEASCAASHARYIGVRLEPQKNEQPTGKVGCSNHSNPGKEDSNV